MLGSFLIVYLYFYIVLGIDTPSIVSGDGTWAALGSNIYLFGFSNVNDYQIILLSSNTLPGLYPPPNLAWIAGIFPYLASF